MGMHFVLEAFSLRPLLGIHALIVQTRTVLERSVPEVVSSVKRMVKTGGRASGKSFMKAAKRGPRAEPCTCGTTEMGKPGEECAFHILVT